MSRFSVVLVDGLPKFQVKLARKAFFSASLEISDVLPLLNQSQRSCFAMIG